MTRSESKPAVAAVKDALLQSPDVLREVVQAVLQEMLEAVSVQRPRDCWPGNLRTRRLRYRRLGVPERLL